MKRLEKISNLRKHPKNPRVIRGVKYKKLLESLKTFPEMLEARPLIVNKDLQVIGGNQRLSALRQLRAKETFVIEVDWSLDRQNEFMIRDNVNSGEWDMDIIANEWDLEQLESFSFDLPNHVFENNIDFDTNRTNLKCEICGK
tara:strand:+ start:1001 stop:1429 length:429 start_codon:yes stop_codon:yes gene_type:complete